ncbi:MAG: SDR family oxidoreductase [Burkholderiales bacterium]
MDLGLAGKVAIVNGSSQGIGYAIARTLAGEGAHVVMTARRAEPLAAAAERVRAEAGVRTLAVRADTRNAEDCARIVERCVAEFGGVDILVNNGGAPPLGPTAQWTDEDWSRAVDRNLMSVVRMARGVVPHMRARGGGRIVNIAAVSVRQPLAGFGLSVATWAGVIGFAKTLSLEVGPDNITVNTILPGRVATDRLATVNAQRAAANGMGADDFAAEMRKGVPLGRVGAPEEIASVVTFLASARSSYVTGTALAVDGGRLATLC